MVAVKLLARDHLGRVIVAVAAGMVLAAFWTVPAQAHVLESDGDISAVLHIPPDDVPVAGKALTLELAFAASDPRFDVNNYRMSVQLQRDGKTLQTADVLPSGDSTRNASGSVQTQGVGAYRLVVRGEPNDGSSKPFELDYDVRAVRDASGGLSGLAAAGADFWIVSLSSLALLVVIAQAMIRQGGRYSAAANKHKT